MLGQDERLSIPRILVVDEDEGMHNYFHEITDQTRVITHVFSRPDDLLDHLAEDSRADLILLDWYLKDHGTDEPALDLLSTIRKSKPLVPVVMLSCFGEPQDFARAYRMGAADIILKPFHKADIDRIMSKHIASAERCDTDRSEIPLDEGTSFVRASRCMREVEEHCRLVAPTDIPVLMLGESGTGKEIAAKFIHKISPRSRCSFLKVNCAAMPLDLLESELFGFEQGAFTGATRAKPGKFELCDNGTIFLDEIGEMPTALQAKLLQVLQDGTFSRLGSRMTVKVNVRVIAATNINMKAAIAAKTFREDLYYRLDGFSIQLPPLRERREEIPILAKYFMSRNASRLGRDALRLTPTLLQAFHSYSWPGNLRELENAVKRYLILADEQEIIGDLHPGLHPYVTPVSDAEASNSGLKDVVRGVKGDAESVLIARTLESTNWNRKAAAAMLQISYKALLYKIKQYQLAEARMA
jgi:DNA-binding NtrC family response regulator